MSPWRFIHAPRRARENNAELSEIIMEINKLQKAFSTLAATTADAAARRPYCKTSNLFIRHHNRQNIPVRFEPQSGCFWLGGLARTTSPVLQYHTTLGLQV
jgi:hypothetical protein